MRPRAVVRRPTKTPSPDGPPRAHLLLLPLACTAALAATSLLPAVAGTTHLRWAVLGTAGVLAAWTGWLLVQTNRQARALSIAVALRPQHYVQACAQGAVLLYWGWYWRDVYEAAHLFAAQLAFAYAWDLLLTWTRRSTYPFGFGPVPIVFSINLFLWFKPDWFYLQFALIAVGFAVKECCRWERNGRMVHVFNPSSFPLGLCALGLILTGATDLTVGQEIATTFNDPPWIYLVIFLASLAGQLRFGVATMTMSAVVTMYLFGLVYFAMFGTYYFVDAYIPVAVFLGMHLLFTDPSTSPRTELGRVVFGATYALSVIALYGILGALGAPTFYDKLLAVPVMNLLVRGIDRHVSTVVHWRPGLETLFLRPLGRHRHLVHVGVWAMVFVGISAAQGIGDTHRGQWVSFWQQACADARPNGCRQFGVLVSTYCERGSGWACNEYGVLVQPQIRPELAAALFRRACDLGFSAGCANRGVGQVNDLVRPPPALDDYELVLRDGTGRQSTSTPLQTYQLACAQGFTDGCRQARRLGGTNEG